MLTKTKSVKIPKCSYKSFSVGKQCLEMNKYIRSIHPFNIDTYHNHYIRLNGCDDIRKMPKINCTGKAPSKAARSLVLTICL